MCVCGSTQDAMVRGWSLPVAVGGGPRRTLRRSWVHGLLGSCVCCWFLEARCHHMRICVLRGPARGKEDSSLPPFAGRDGSLGQEQRRFAVTQLSHPGWKLSAQFLPLTSACSLAPVDVRKSEWHLGKGLLMSDVLPRHEAAGGG